MRLCQSNETKSRILGLFLRGASLLIWSLMVENEAESTAECPELDERRESLDPWDRDMIVEIGRAHV